MEYTVIAVPDMNDSFSRVVLGGQAFQIRFTWNDTAQRWMWGLYTTERVPIIEGVRVVPSFPLNLPYAHSAGLSIGQSTCNHNHNHNHNHNQYITLFPLREI